MLLQMSFMSTFNQIQCFRSVSLWSAVYIVRSWNSIFEKECIFRSSWCIKSVKMTFISNSWFACTYDFSRQISVSSVFLMKQEIQKILFLFIIVLRNCVCFSASVEAVVIETLTDIVFCMTWEFCWTFNWNFKIVSINERMIDWIDSSDLKMSWC